MPTDKYGSYPNGSGIGATAVSFVPKQMRADDYKIVLAVQGATAGEMEKFKFFMRRYPGPKVPTTYVRTNTLHDTWDMRDFRGFATDVFNPTPYAPYVYGNNHGDGQQLQHKQTGWPIMYEEFQKRKPAIAAAARAALKLEVARQGLAPGD